MIFSNIFERDGNNKIGLQLVENIITFFIFIYCGYFGKL